MNYWSILGLAILMIACKRDTDLKPTDTVPTDHRSIAFLAGSGFSSNNNYLVISRGDMAAASQEVAAAGGQVLRTHPELNLIIATSTSANFTTTLSSSAEITAVHADLLYDYSQAELYPSLLTASQISGISPQTVNANSNTFYPLQWAHQAINTEGAWAQGYTGNGIRVAVIDGGFYPSHQDIVSNVNLTLSKSFVTGDPVLEKQNTGFGHGTHVAGIIASTDNNLGTVGVAPGAELVLIKVLNDADYGSFGDMISGILYAASINSDVINLSMGGYESYRNLPPGLRSIVSEMVNLTTQAIQYATNQGVTVVAAAGNSAMDPHSQGVILIPAELPQAISVSALGPQGFYTGSTNYDLPAYYTNFGMKTVDISAPGGYANLAFPTGWYYDMVLSPGEAPNRYYFAQGTSMACPHVTGVVALMLEANPNLNPNSILAKLIQTSDDLGKPGRDPYYGNGRINASNAVQ